MYGATNCVIKAVRSFSCNALGEMRGKSTFARVTLGGYDAGAVMAIDPILHWAKAIWDVLVPRQRLEISWKAAIVSVAGAARPFGAVRGPAGAMVASARRIGWEIPSPWHLMIDGHTIICLDEVSPRDVQLLAERALRHKEAPKSSFALRSGVSPDLEPLSVFLHSIRRTSAAASLRTLGEGGWWTQDRMYAAGFEGDEDDLCRACHGHVGSLYHRCCACPALAGLRGSSKKHQDILSVAQSIVHHQEPLFQHGVPELTKHLPPPRFVVRWCGGIEVADFQFAGNVFSDGSVRSGYRRGMRGLVGPQS